MAKGLVVERLARQMAEIDRLNAELHDITLLKGIEVGILEDGHLDLPASVLSRLDLVVAAVHSKFDLSRGKQTARILRAMDAPHFTILAHPSGRLIGEREAYDVDMARIIHTARQRGCFLELNAHPERLDLSDVYCNMTKSEDVLISIASDAHSTLDFANLRFAIGQARRGWLAGSRGCLEYASVCQIAGAVATNHVSAAAGHAIGRKEMNTAHTPAIELQDGDALIIVDVQNDFLPGGALAVPHGDEVVPVLNHYIDLFLTKGLPIIATRDWHPLDHCSFHAQGGPWPPHCIANGPGAEFAAGLRLPAEFVIISKAAIPDKDAYSGFGNTELEAVLRSHGVRRVFVGGLATDYCVLNTVKDALDNRYQVYVLDDAIRAVNVHPDDGRTAEQEMIAKGAIMITLDQCS